MGKWVVEMSYGLNVTVDGIEAETREEAIAKAQDLVEEDKDEYASVSDLEFEMTTFVSEE